MKKLILLLLICIIAASAVYALVFRDAPSASIGGEKGNNEESGDVGGSVKNPTPSAGSAHPNKNPETAQDHLKAAGYYTKLLTYTDREDGLVARLEASLNSAETPADFECINIYYYETKAKAEAAWPELEQDGDAVKEIAAYLGYGSSVVCKKNGTVIYYGTKNAVDAAK